MDDLYREVIIEHYKNPGYRGHLDPHDIRFEDNNPLCGDHIEITLQVTEDGTVKDARFDGHGCAISQASADLLIESVIGKPLEAVKQLNKQDILDLLGIDLRWFPGERVLEARSRRSREVALDVQVVHIQGVTTVVLQFDRAVKYQVATRGPVVDIAVPLNQ